MRRITTALLALSIAVGTPCVLAEEFPDAKVNPQTGVIEIADPVWAGDNYDIRYVVAPGEKAKISDVTANPADDRRPRMAIAPGGDAYVVWWRDSATSQVLIRRHDHAADNWTAESVISDDDLPGRNPEIVHDGSDPWVAFAESEPLETVIKVGAIEDAPDPFGMFYEIGSTSFEGDLDLRIHAAAGHLWVTWTDSALEIAWTEYDYASTTWSSAEYESYADDSMKHAQERIHQTVLGD